MSKLFAFLCVLLSTSTFDPAAAQPSPYVVDGLALGGKVRFESQEYQQYHCSTERGNSLDSPGVTKKKTRKGPIAGKSFQLIQFCTTRMARAVYV